MHRDYRYSLVLALFLLFFFFFFYRLTGNDNAQCVVLFSYSSRNRTTHPHCYSERAIPMSNNTTRREIDFTVVVRRRSTLAFSNSPRKREEGKK